LYAFFYSYLYRGNTGEISLSELRTLLSIKKSQYKLVGHLKNRLLEPSISLINRVTDINVSCMPYKHGRRIAGFIFDIKKGLPQKTSHKLSKPPIPRDNKPHTSAKYDDTLEEKYISIGISASEYRLLLKKL